MRVTSIEAARAALLTGGQARVSYSRNRPKATAGARAGIYAKRYSAPPGVVLGAWTVGDRIITAGARSLPLVRSRLVASGTVLEVLPVNPRGSTYGPRLVVEPDRGLAYRTDGRAVTDYSDQLPYLCRGDQPGDEGLARWVVLWDDVQPVQLVCPLCGAARVLNNGNQCHVCRGAGRVQHPIRVPGGDRLYGWWNWWPSAAEAALIH